MTPTIIVESDYDGYFEAWVKRLVTEKENAKQDFNHSRIVISAGPWRSSVVSYNSSAGTIHLDFYSAFRTGFGYLTKEDREALKDKL